MPSHIPRTDATKKREQLARRGQELEHAVHAALPREHLLRAAESVRAAQLSLLKAELHWIQAAKIVGREPGNRERNILHDQQYWTEVAVDEIVQRYAKVIPPRPN